MVKQTRILKREDTRVIPVFLEIFHRRLKDIEPFYEGTPLIQEAREIYTPQYIAACLNGERSDSRFIGHFQDESLDGLLIEGFQTQEYEGKQEPTTTLKWVMASQDGKGVGGDLIDDCIARAIEENKLGIQLIYANRNGNLEERYAKHGFGFNRDHPTYPGIISIMSRFTRGKQNANQ